MNAALKARAQAVAGLWHSSKAFTSAQFREIEDVYRLVIGKHKPCYSCVVYGLINEISQKLIQQPLKIKNMATAKGVFKKEHAGVKVIRETKNGTIAITSDNLNSGDNFAYVAQHYGHLVEEAKAPKTEATEEAPKTEAKAKSAATISKK